MRHVSLRRVAPNVLKAHREYSSFIIAFGAVRGRLYRRVSIAMFSPLEQYLVSTQLRGGRRDMPKTQNRGPAPCRRSRIRAVRGIEGRAVRVVGYRATSVGYHDAVATAHAKRHSDLRSGAS